MMFEVGDLGLKNRRVEAGGSVVYCVKFYLVSSR